MGNRFLFARTVLSALIGGTCLLGLSLTGSGTPTINARIGFDGHVVAQRFAPCTVVLSGIDPSLEGSLVVTQRIGNAWTGTSEVKRRLLSGLLGNGEYRCTLPIYEPLNDLHFELLDRDDRLLASHDVSLRERRRIDPFPVVCSSSAFLPEPEAVRIVSSQLPMEWWAYEGVQRLWLASAPSRDAWQAIAQWVLAGGSLLLLTGDEFYLLDSPLTRELIPLASPYLTATEDGGWLLTGTMKADATPLVTRDALPVAIARSYGAGTVTLVTVSSQDLLPTEIAALLTQVRSSSLLSLESFSADLLQGTPVNRPSHLAVLVLIGGGLLGLTLAIRWGERHHRPAIGWILPVSVALSVLSGFMTNRENIVSDIYEIRTGLSIQTNFGSSIHSFCLLSLRPAEQRIESPGEGFLVQRIPDPRDGGNLDAVAERSTTRIVLQPREQRVLAAYGTSCLPVMVEFHEATVQIEAPVEAVGTCATYATWSGRLFELPALETGTYTISPNRGIEIETYEGEYGSLLRALAEQVPFQKGHWIVAIDEEEELASTGQARKKVRHVVVRLFWEG